MAVYSSAGSAIAISAALPATYDQAGYEALTFSAIGEITNLGAFGKTYNQLSHNPLAERNTQYRKGGYEYPEMPLEMAWDEEDAGQDIVRAALDSDNSYAFEITHQNGTVIYFTAQVFSYVTNIGTNQDVTTASSTVRPDRDWLAVLPA